MSVLIPIEHSVSDAHRAATDDVNRWRGHCVESYARLELEVTTTLYAMAAAPDAKVSVPHNFGEKVKKLRLVIEPGQPFANAKLAKGLHKFEDHLIRRNMLVHSVGRVLVDAKGQWVWHYRFLPSGKGLHIESGFFEQDIALEIEKSLARGTQSLGGQLQALRTKLEVGAK